MTPEKEFDIELGSDLGVNQIAKWIKDQGGRPSEAIIFAGDRIMTLDIVNQEPVVTFIKKTGENSAKVKFYFGREIAEQLRNSGLI